jgi:hypothetical protein
MVKDYYIPFGLDMNVLTYMSNMSKSTVGQLVPGPAIAAAFFVVLVILIVFI